jgi:putative SOS response-associated peptidase YedK
MCGRFTNQYTWRELHALYMLSIGFERNTDWTPKYNIAPTNQIPVILHEAGERRVVLMRWGLVPSWAREIGKFSTFNARADGITTKPMFRGAWAAGRRCLIPASSFFEWRKPDKQPFAIALGNRGAMAFAGLWDEWTPKGGQPLRSCTLITCAPNTLLAPLHDRMPVILGAEDWAQWLGEEPAEREALTALLKPFPAERMTLWKVASAVGNVRNENAELIEPLKA